MHISQLSNQLLIHNKRINIPNDFHCSFLSRIDDFCEKLLEKNQSIEFYQAHREGKNALENIKIGKYGELVAQQFFLDCGFPQIEIDFDIRNGKSKMWKCDLPYKDYDNKLPNVHVKACDARTRNFVKKHCNDEYSWTFQWSNKNDNFGKDRLFLNSDNSDVIAFVYVPDFGSQGGIVVATAPWRIIEPLLENPIMPELKNLKRCIYGKRLGLKLSTF